MSTPIQITERHVADITILTITGRLILEEGDLPLRDRINDLVRQGRTKLLLDLQHVTRLDSAGLGMLAAKYLTARRQGGVLKLLHVTDRISHLLKITRLTTVFEIFESEEAALRSFGIEPVR